MKEIAFIIVAFVAVWWFGRFLTRSHDTDDFPRFNNGDGMAGTDGG